MVVIVLGENETKGVKTRTVVVRGERICFPDKEIRGELTKMMMVQSRWCERKNKCKKSGICFEDNKEGLNKFLNLCNGEPVGTSLNYKNPFGSDDH